jgi:hypothetical protein
MSRPSILFAGSVPGIMRLWYDSRAMATCFDGRSGMPSGAAWCVWCGSALDGA